MAGEFAVRLEGKAKNLNIGLCFQVRGCAVADRVIVETKSEMM